MADTGHAERVFAAWYEAREQGAAVPASRLLDAHPDIADDLRARLSALDLVDDVLILERSAAPRKLGPYRLLRTLGAGGMGSVHLAEAQETSGGLAQGTRVALKLLHPHLLERPGFFRRFMREADLGRTVDHSNVVRTLAADALVVDGATHHFLVMEYVEGKTLRELVAELDRLPESLCRHIASEVTKGLAAIHAAGAVHRDLKPDNVLITDDHVVKVMDLGVARLADETLRLSQTGAFVGSLAYAAPEQFGKGDVDARADLHALGVLLYEIASGVHPYDDDDARVVMNRILKEPPRRLGDVNSQLSPFFEELVHALLAKSADERFASADELLGVLERAEDSEWWSDRARALRAQTKQPLRRIRIPRETAVYGRDADLDRLSDLYRAATAGDGRVLLLEGEAGIGKTRLVDEFVARLVASGENVHFLFASYPPGGAATASGAFSAAFRKHLGVEDLEEAVGSVLPDTPLLVPAFAALLRGDSAPEGSLLLTKDSMQTCFVQATRNLAQDRTTIVLIDDLHFAPDEGRALFASLALAVPDHRILLVGTMRPSVPADWTANVARFEQTTHAVLERLGPKDLFALLSDSFRSERLAEDLGMRIAVKSDGNPFFVFEIIRGLREGQLLRQRPDGTWETTQIIDEIEVPSSVLDLVNARVADLSEQERNLLDIAACWGFEFDPGLVADVLGIARIPALQTLAHIEKRHRLVRSSGRRFVFDHHQVQEALYQALPEMLREEYHAALAGAMEQQSGALVGDRPDVGGAVCAQLVSQFIRGACPARCARYLEPAVRHLERTGDPATAAALVTSVLDAPRVLSGADRARGILLYTSVAQPCGRYEDAARASREAAALAVELGDEGLELAALLSLGNCLHPIAANDEGIEVLERALDLARRLGDPVREGRALGSLGNIMDAIGRLDAALAFHRASLALAERLGDETTEVTELGHIAGVLWHAQKLDEARAVSERHMRRAVECGGPVGVGLAHGMAGNLAWESSDLESAAMHYRVQFARARETGFRRMEVVATGNLGGVAHCLGNMEEAESAFRRQAELAREIGYWRGLGLAEGNLGANALKRGDIGAALPLLRSSVERLRANRCGVSIHGALLPLAETYLGLGDIVRAAAAAREAVTVAEELGVPALRRSAEILLADAAPESPGRVDSESDLRRICDESMEAGDMESAAGALWRLARRELARGAPHLARRTLDADLRAVSDTCSTRLLMRLTSLRASIGGTHVEEAEQARELHGPSIIPFDEAEYELRLFRATSDTDRLASANALLGDLIASAPDEHVEAMCTKVRVHREILAAWRALQAGTATESEAPTSGG